MCAAVRAAAASNARILSSLKPPPNVVVVGGTSGIGRAIALSIGQHCPSASITIIGRNQSAADAILSQLGSNSKFIRADVSLMSEIRNATKKINVVDMLILTQGILTMAGRTPTTENIDNKLALHYYGRVLFVQELLPLLRSSQNGGKVLFVLGGVNENPSKINWDDMSLENAYSLSAAANHTTSFTDLAIKYLGSQPENTNVAFTHANPGGVNTPIADNLPFWARLPLKGLMAGLLPLGLRVTPEDCAEYMVHGMLGADKGYTYIGTKGEPVTKKKPVQEEMVQKVWEQHCSNYFSQSLKIQIQSTLPILLTLYKLFNSFIDICFFERINIVP